MQILVLILICCPIALFYLLPKYIQLRERYIKLEKNSVSLDKYNAVKDELHRLKQLLAAAEGSHMKSEPKKE